MYIIHIIYIDRSQDMSICLPFTGTNFCDLVTSGETDPMEKHHAADCQDPKDAAATSDPFGGNKVNMG